jgi:hypothetical protein
LELQPRHEPLELVDGEPAVLADILSERRTADLPIDLRGELPVVSTVGVDNLRPLSHTPSLRADSNAAPNRSQQLSARRGVGYQLQWAVSPYGT